jgi:PmbA protein
LSERGLSELLDIAQFAVERAAIAGASDSECTAMEGNEFSVSVRMREVEQLKEAGSRGVGIRVLIGQRAGSSYTSDLSRDGIVKMVDAAVNLARIASEDKFAGMPAPGELGSLPGDLQLFDPAIAEMAPEWKIEQAKRAEEAALSYDPRIRNSEGASFDSFLGQRAFANSRGFGGCYRTSSCGLAASPVAQENGSMERDYWHSSARAASRVESAEYVGQRAAQRALRRLGSRKVATQKVPVVFEPRTARALLDDLFGAFSGAAIYRNASFLVGKLGQRVASAALTIVDDGCLPGLFGTAPFDDEGVRSGRTNVIEDGVLASYLNNSYTGRRLGQKTTANASRGLSGNAGVGPGNLFIAAGVRSPEEIIAGVRNGLYVTSLIGTQADTMTGDYSSGCSGVWIENGELAYPVSEITIAGDLKQMLNDIEHVGSDLEFRGSIASPTLLVREMTVSGQ